MKQFNLRALLFVLAIQINYITPLDVLKSDKNVMVVGDVLQREHRLEGLKKEKEVLVKDEKIFLTNLQRDLNNINEKIVDFKKKLLSAKGQDRDYYNTIIGVLNETAQSILDIQLMRQKTVQNIDSHISVLEGYLKEPSFKQDRIETRFSYAYKDLEGLYTKVLSTKEQVIQLKEQKKTIDRDLEDSKQAIIIIAKELKEKQGGRIDVNSKGKTNLVLGVNWSIAQESQLLDFEIELQKFKERLLELQVQDLTYQQGLFATRIDIAGAKLEVLEESLEIVEKGLRISESEVDAVQAESIIAQKKSADAKAAYTAEIQKLNGSISQLKQQFTTTLKQFKIELSSPHDLDNWQIDISKYHSEVGIYRLAYLNEEIQTIISNKEILEASKVFENAKISTEEVLSKIITTRHKISQRNLRTEEEIQIENAFYAAHKQESQKALASYKDKIEVAPKSINNASKALSNLNNISKDLLVRRKKFIDRYGSEAYDRVGAMLDKSKELLKKRIDLSSKLIEIYSSIILAERDILRQIEIIEDRLGKIGGILQRSEHAISWDNIKNIAPSLGMFVVDLRNIIMSNLDDITLKGVSISAWNYIRHPLTLLVLFLKILLLLLAFGLLRIVLPFIVNKLKSMQPTSGGLGSLWGATLLIAVFVHENLIPLAMWFIPFTLIKIGMTTSLGLHVLFYLISIPWLCFLVRKLIIIVLKINRGYGHPILNENFEVRFVRVFGFFCYSTVIIFFFREAFVSIAYESDLPKVLSALYSVILRASIIFLIGKEEVAGVIPERSAIWGLLRTYLLRYYYPLMIGIVAIMVVSDPYILGFSKLVTHIFRGSVITLILFLALWWLQGITRRFSAYAFFESTDIGSKERFHNAKTWYGLFVILSYAVAALISILVLSRVWGHAVEFDDLYGWLSYESSINVLKRGVMVPLTPKDFLMVVVYLITGIWTAWAFERFVLARTFALLLVDNGVQNTVSIISRYCIVTLIFLFGLAELGMSSFIVYVFGAIAFGLVWAIKDPVNDFISYFLILIDRTVKIGDYVQVNENVMGVVRKISPRATLIRRKNSVSIIVPNSKITAASVYNWGYARGFFAFNDVKITVAFSADPKKVKQIIHQVLDENLNVLKNPSPIIRLNEFGEHGFVFLIRGFLSSINVLNQWDILSDIRFTLVETLRENGISIATPVRMIINKEEIGAVYNLPDMPKEDDFSSEKDQKDKK